MCVTNIIMKKPFTLYYVSLKCVLNISIIEVLFLPLSFYQLSELCSLLWVHCRCPWGGSNPVLHYSPRPLRSSQPVVGLGDLGQTAKENVQWCCDEELGGLRLALHHTVDIKSIPMLNYLVVM